MNKTDANHVGAEKSSTPGGDLEFEDGNVERAEPPVESEVAAEQRYVTMLYDRLDGLRARAEGRLTQALITPTADNDQAASEREDFARSHRARGAELDQVERGLCFGRIDLDPTAGREGHGDMPERLYIGRLGMLDDDYNSLLVDWRAPAAQRFYRATYADRQGVRLRRHIYTRGRIVTGLDDDVLDIEALGGESRSHLIGEGALLASLEAGRTGRMTDIVATIQAEQDRIIRSDLRGILVVEGGPGTGKTVVALHRAAYLLYTHRGWLGKRGVLVIGPNATFVRYIDHVLPSLGETDVVMATVGELYPGVATVRLDPPETAVVKGDLRMVEVIEGAVRARQRVPREALRFRIDGSDFVLDRMTCLRARDRARRTGLPHNRARAYLAESILDEVTEQEVEHVGREWAGMYDKGAVRRMLAQEDKVIEAIDWLWPELTPKQLLADLYTDPEFLAESAPFLTEDERLVLLRSKEKAYDWTVADVPILDEIPLLVGDTDLTLFERRRAEAASDAEAAAARTYAEKIAEEYAEAQWSEDEERKVVSDGNLVAERYATAGLDDSIADRALRDREWEFGHVIVDEAQELSPMAWRLLARRCPGRSMTIVGDIAQTGAAEGARSWAEVLDPFASGRWSTQRLSVNYRTPAEIMTVAADVLHATSPDLEPPTSVRRSGDRPWARGFRAYDELGALVGHESEAIGQQDGEGKVAVVVAERELPAVAERLEAVVPSVATSSSPELLDAPVAVLTPLQAKGLEFDAVIVVDPDVILAASPRGASDLYVALTRATRRLGIAHRNPLPPMLAGLAEAEPAPVEP